MSEIVKFKGVVDKCVCNKADFKIYALNVSSHDYPEIKQNKYSNVSILGELFDLTLGVEYEVEGIEQETKYGYAYRVTNIRRESPKTQEDMYLFLREILTPNQARVLYENYPDIVERVRDNRLDDVDLNKLKGIKEYTFNSIKNKIVENFCLVDLVVEFQGYFTMSVLKKLYLEYTSVEKIKYELQNNPYKCLCSLAGIGFKKADGLLLEIDKISKQNIEKGQKPIISFTHDLKTSKQRCLSCVIYLLSENEKSGHTKMNLVELRSECIKLVPDCADHFTDAIKNKDIYYNKTNLEAALRQTYDNECKIAETILTALLKENVWDYDVEKYRDVNGCMLSDEQMQAVSNVCKYSISILNGAAGVGKSFSTQAIINMLKDHKKTFRLFSPTGKAAKVLTEYTKEKATTIHRGLGYMPPRTWNYDRDNKLSCDVLIVDEFSMVDVFLFTRVLDAIDFEHTKLVLIGDNAQLPSISCGNLLHDFIQTNVIPTTTLTKVFRYGEGGLMKVATDVRFCKPYLTNEMKNTMTVFGDNEDYTFIDMPTDNIPENVVKLYKKLMEKGYKTTDIQVLTAKNVSDCGTIMLNNMIQQVANPNYGSSICFKIGDTVYYEGDLVIQKVNNYNAIIVDEDYCVQSNPFSDEEETAFIANGETGIIKAIFNSFIIIDFDGVLVKYGHENIKDIGLGYSITIHKSQGSGIKIVILCTPKSHIFMLNSNLIYVGLTRMKEKCYHLGTLNSVNKSVVKKANLVRHTFMQDLLLNPEP